MDPFKTLSTVLKAAAGLFALLPGIAAVAGGIGVPPDKEPLFGGVLTAVGVVVLLLLALHRPARPPDPGRVRRRATRQIVALLAGFLVLLFLYSWLYGRCVKHGALGRVDAGGAALPDSTVEVYLPLFPSGRLAGMIRNAGGDRQEAIDYHDTPAIRRALETQEAELAVTDAVLLVLYAATILTLVGALAVAGWAFESVHGAPDPAAEPPPEAG